MKRAGSLRDRYGTKERGRPIRFERVGKALELEQQVRDLNDFLDGFDLRGGSHRGYVRGFNQGDHPAFAWNKGGRMYSQGDDSYQRLSRDDRLRMTINGEEVCEIDIRASYLTIYHAHYGAPLDRERDPYALPGFPAEARDILKLWFVATFGNNGHLDRWPRETAAEYREKQGRELGKRYPVKRIRKIAIEQFPLLEKWGTDEFGWADLMFIESQAMLGAMQELMEPGHTEPERPRQPGCSGLQARDWRGGFEPTLPERDWCRSGAYDALPTAKQTRRAEMVRRGLS